MGDMGGSLNATVCHRMKAGTHKVATAEEFATVASEVCPNVRIMYISYDSVVSLQSVLDEHWQELIPVPNTLDVHSVHTLAPYVISVAHTSEDVERRVHKLQRNVLL